MIITTRNNQQVLLRRLTVDDIDLLFNYLQQLSEATKKRFGPHPFDKQSVVDFYQEAGSHRGYVALSSDQPAIIAYSIIKPGFLEHDSIRLQSYGLQLNGQTDCTFAPSVADQWQSCGIGNSLFHFMISDLKTLAITRIILWGGVQKDNEKAVNYYRKNGFKTLGQFEYQGVNYDMILDLV